MKKRVLTAIFALCMLLMLIPVAAGAETTVGTVDLAVSHPVHGANPDPFIQVYGGGCMLDTSFNTNGFVQGVRWSRIGTGKHLTESDTFIGGQLYELSVALKPKDGYVFSASQSQVTVNGEEASVTVNDTGAMVRITLEGANLYIHTVEVSGLDVPKTGNVPDYVINVADGIYHPVESGYAECKNGVTWYDATDMRYLPLGTKFEAGHEYWAEILLQAREGYEFPIKVTGYVDGKLLDDVGGMGKQIVLIATFQPTQEHTHTPSEWRFTQDFHYKVCTVCGEHIDQEEHRWSPTYLYYDQNGHAWVCADCKTHSTVYPHIPGAPATATTPQTCQNCEYVIAEAGTVPETTVPAETTQATEVTEETEQTVTTEETQLVTTEETQVVTTEETEPAVEAPTLPVELRGGNKTADDTPWLWILLAVLALACLGTIIVLIVKNKKKA